MRTLAIILTFIFVSTVTAFSQVENVAKEVLNAYKNKDVELLKKNASGILKLTISESYFEDKNVQEDAKAIAGWDGTIKEVRYGTGSLMGRKMISATAYYADAGADQIHAVLLSSLDNGKNWVFMGTGLATLKKEEFEQLSVTLPADGAKTDSKKEAKSSTKPANSKEKSKAASNFSVELANGDTFDKITEAKMVECINSLNDDNFFIILKDKENFIQAAFSDGKFDVQYKENEQQFTVEKVLTKDETIQLFKDYYQGKDNWKKEIVWKKME